MIIKLPFCVIKKEQTNLSKMAKKNLLDRSETMAFWVGDEGEVKKTTT